jgi:glycosyltransferase involved in cell wall biosynthesis
MIAPYFMNFTNVKYQPEGKNILFFGAMNRPENYLSAIWFIENVIPLISDRQMRFVIAGGNPHPKLHAYASERVQVLGYVEDMAPLFSKALCFCAPLILGAGIKVKVIEAMSAGLPTLTNSIGIEGIPAKNGIDYIHCETADDYAKNIEMLMDHKFDVLSLSCNSKALIQNHFNIESSYLSLQRRFAQLIDNKPTSGSF